MNLKVKHIYLYLQFVLLVFDVLCLLLLFVCLFVVLCLLCVIVNGVIEL